MKEISYDDVTEYYLKEYNAGPVWRSMLSALENFANVGPNIKRKRERLLHPFWYSDISLDCDGWYDIITRSIRRGDLDFTCEQAKEYLRFNRLLLMFDSVVNDIRYANSEYYVDPEKFKEFCLSHPIWARLERQAQKTLDSLRIKK